MSSNPIDFTSLGTTGIIATLLLAGLIFVGNLYLKSEERYRVALTSLLPLAAEMAAAVKSVTELANKLATREEERERRDRDRLDRLRRGDLG